jgi:glutathione S-transferase
MYVLHYAPDNASLVVRLALEELGVPYRTALVDRAAQAQEGAAYRALSPTGLIPALETPEGAIFETGAILLWLADRHGGLAPAPGRPRARRFPQVAVLHVEHASCRHARPVLSPAPYAGGDKEGGSCLTEGRILRALGLLDAALAARPDWCRPARPGRSAAISRRSSAGSRSIPDPNPMAPPRGLSRAPRRCCRSGDPPLRPPRGRGRGAGPTPFTAPSHPAPPEGSAT